MARGGRGTTSLLARARPLFAPVAVMAVSRVLVYAALAAATLVVHPARGAPAHVMAFAGTVAVFATTQVTLAVLTALSAYLLP